MRQFTFERLECWKQAKGLAVWVYQVTRQFPSDEKFGIISQMRRASVSIAANLAEGSSRLSYKDQIHFSTIAYSSSVELLNHLIISFEVGYLQKPLYDEGRSKLESLTFLVSRFREFQIKGASQPTK